MDGLQQNANIITYPVECQERAAIYEYDAGMKREDAEKRAIEEWEKNNDW